MFRDFFSKDTTSFKTKSRTKTKTKDKDKTIPKNKAKTKTKDMDKAIPKSKTEDKDMLNKIDNEISIIIKTSIILAKINVKVKKED